jgi:sugar phosphate isomerase/epimerase
MTLPIGVQLYSVRENAGADYAGTIRKIAEMGYAGVEPAGYPGTDVQAAAKLFKELGLEVPSVHTGMPMGESKDRVLAEMAELGCTRIVTGKGPDDFKTVDKIKETCDLFNSAATAATTAGLSFGIHNHDWEYKEVDGKLVIDYMEELLAPEVFYEIDTYWVTVAGQNAPEIIARLGERVQLLHIKDGPGVREKAMLAAGDGIMDFPSIVAAAKSAKYLIVELDRCDTDMMEAVARSFNYLKDAGLGHGK